MIPEIVKINTCLLFDEFTHDDIGFLVTSNPQQHSYNICSVSSDQLLVIGLCQTNIRKFFPHINFLE